MMKTFAAIFALSAVPALAQPAAIPVYYAYDQPGMSRWMVDKAMHAVLDRPEFAAAAKRDAHVLEVNIADKIVRDSGDNARGFTFMLGFYRGGDKLGEASEYCRTDKLADCADQLAADITSADAIRH